LKLYSATEEATLSALNIHSTFVDMSPSTTAGHLLYSVLKLHYAETITSALQLETHLQAAPSRTIPIKSQYCWAASLSDSR
jgi:hypothetical protein